MAAVGVLTAYADTTTSTASAPALTSEIKYPWESSVSAGLSLTRGNSHTLLFSAEVLTQKKTPVNEYLLGASGAYGTQDSSDTVNNYKAFGQLSSDCRSWCRLLFHQEHQHLPRNRSRRQL